MYEIIYHCFFKSIFILFNIFFKQVSKHCFTYMYKLVSLTVNIDPTRTDNKLHNIKLNLKKKYGYDLPSYSNQLLDPFLVRWAKFLSSQAEMCLLRVLNIFHNWLVFKCNALLLPTWFCSSRMISFVMKRSLSLARLANLASHHWQMVIKRPQ